MEQKIGGDGTSDSTTSHTYSDYGKYTIKCSGTTLTSSSFSGVFHQSENNPNYYVKTIRFGNVTTLTDYSFFCCSSLESVLLSASITTIGTGALRSCKKLKNIIVPQNTKTIQVGAFMDDWALQKVLLPKGGTALNESLFKNCYSLENINISKEITTIGTNTFNSCYNISEYDFSGFTSIPTLSSTNAFGNINPTTKIKVPSRLYSTWKAATNWSTYENNIVSDLKPIELTYIQGDGSAFIDTGIKVSRTDWMLVNFINDDNSTAYGRLFGIGYYFVQMNDQNLTKYMLVRDNNNHYTQFNMDATNGFSLFIDINSGKLFNASNSQQLTGTNVTIDITKSLVLWSYINYDTISKMKLQKVEIHDSNDVLLHELKPYIDPYGVVCLYDTVEEEYLYNTGSGAFIAGSVVE